MEIPNEIIILGGGGLAYTILDKVFSFVKWAVGRTNGKRGLKDDTRGATFLPGHGDLCQEHTKSISSMETIIPLIKESLTEIKNDIKDIKNGRN